MRSRVRTPSPHAVEHALNAGKRVIYTAPIKALSNQKYRDLMAAWPGQVGIATGDVSIDPEGLQQAAQCCSTCLVGT